MSELTLEQLRMPVGLKVGDYEMTNCCGGKIKKPKKLFCLWQRTI